MEPRDLGFVWMQSQVKGQEKRAPHASSFRFISIFLIPVDITRQTQAASPRKTPLTQLTTEFLVPNFKAMFLFSQVIRDSSTVYLLCIYWVHNLFCEELWFSLEERSFKKKSRYAYFPKKNQERCQGNAELEVGKEENWYWEKENTRNLQTHLMPN